MEEPLFRNWQYIIIHHSSEQRDKYMNWDAIKEAHVSYTVDSTIVSRGVFLFCREIEPEKHIFKKAWDNIGYHFGIEKIDKEYCIRYGRNLNTIGAHTFINGTRNYFNRYSIGICMVGNYNREQPETNALKMLIVLCGMLVNIFNIPKENIIGHREAYILSGNSPKKNCPGDKFDLEELRRLL